MLLLVASLLAFFLSFLKPLDERLNVMQKDTTALGVAALLIPEQNGVLTNDVSIIQNTQNAAEQLQQLAVFIAVHLKTELV